jgi:hypothetical protein
MNADLVAVVDDDNIPLPGWGEKLMVGSEVEVDCYDTDLPVFDPVGATNYPQLWHRGYPIQLVSKRDYRRKSRKVIRADVQADFWNGDPDIDAICRMEHAPECKFDDSYFPMMSTKISPFNSQNTFIAGAILRDYFMFPHIGRMDDIWAAYYVQAKRCRVVYGKASVYQDRNVHDLIRDMRQEYLGYENNLQLVEDLAHDPESIMAYLPGRSAFAFQLYKRHFEKA